MTTIKSQLASTYRALLPPIVREPAWCVTRAAWAALVLRDPREARNRYAQYLVARAKNNRDVRLEEGFTLTVDLRDEGVGRAIYVQRRYERGETELLKSYVRPGMTIVDIGANLGYYTVLCARLVGENGCVLAIEPDPDNYRLLVENIRRNRLTNVIPVNAALGRESGTARLHRSASNFGDHRIYETEQCRTTVEVAIRTLDDVLAHHEVETIDLIKMDVQGYEVNVIAGMSHTLERRAVRAILMEYWPFGIEGAGGDPDAMVKTLQEAHFRFHRIRNEHSVHIAPENLRSALPYFNPDEPDGCFINLWLVNDGPQK